MIRRMFIICVRLLPVLAILLLVSQVVVSNHLVSAGKSTVGIDEEVRLLQAENDILRQEVATATSLLTVETKAIALGLATYTTTITLSPPNIAYNPQ